MASPMPETVTISIEEYSNLLTTQLSADYVYGIVHFMAWDTDPSNTMSAKEFAMNLLDEWTK